MIWDGVTEYSNVQPPGTLGPWFLRMHGDGTRRFFEQLVAGSPGNLLRDLQREGWEIIGVTFTRPTGFTEGDRNFLDYDGTLRHEPVNQRYQLDRFFGHAARFAHQLDAALGHHSLQSATEEDRMTVLHTLSAMIGSATRRYKVWEVIDPEQQVVGGTFDGTPLWKRTQSEYEQIDEGLCGQCDIVTYARRFLFHANLPLFRRLHRSGIIYAVNRDTTPWEAVLFDVATQPESEFYVELETEYQGMLRHYDNVVGADPNHP